MSRDGAPDAGRHDLEPVDVDVELIDAPAVGARVRECGDDDRGRAGDVEILDPGRRRTARRRRAVPGRSPRWVWSRPAATWASWAARHRTPARILARIPAALAVAAVVAGIAVLLTRTTAGPPLPSLDSAQPILPGPEQPDLQQFWTPLPDGRASSPVTVTLATRLNLRHRPGDTVTVLGAAGPGIVRTAGASPVVGPDTDADPATDTVAADLTARLDCRRVPIPVPERAYGLLVEVRDATTRRRTAGTMAAGAAGVRFGRLVQSACGSWLARQDLTVMAASARFEPLQPWADLDLTIGNTGSRAARLESFAERGGLQLRVRHGAPGGRGDPGGQNSAGDQNSSGDQGGDVTGVTLPAARQTVLQLRLTAVDCGAVTATTSAAAIDRPTSTSDLLALFADVAPKGEPAAVPAIVDGFVGAGIVLAPRTAEPVVSAVSHLCAGLRPVVASVNAVHLDRRARQFTVDLTIDLEPPVVTSVAIAPGSVAVPQAFVPVWTARDGLVPDASGQVAIRLAYRPPPGSACPYGDVWPPSFSLTVRVPVAGGVRTIRFPELNFQPPDEQQLAQLCG